MYQASNVYFICGFAAIGGGLFGFDISSMSGVIGTEAYKRYFGHPVSYYQGGITAAMPFGSLFGALASSFIADKLSRRTAIQVAALTWCLGSIIQASANGVAALVVGRVIGGFCIGIASCVVPIYQAEVAPKEIRGRVVSLQQWAITWGILIQFLIQFGASHVGNGPDDPNQPTTAFRIPFGVQAVPGVVLFFGMFFMPRSPRWLASKDRWEEAIEVLAMLHGKGDMNSPRVLAEYQEIEEALRFEREDALSSLRQLVAPRMLRRVVLGMSVQMWSQLCGINVMMYYIVYIMESANIGNPLVASSIQYVINVVFTLPAIIFIDKWGRRPSMVIGAFLMMIMLFISGTLQAVYGEPYSGAGSSDATTAKDDVNLSDITWIIRNNRPVSIAMVACSYLFVATFSTTWGPSSWTYSSEIYPSLIRARAVSLATASNWFFNCVLAFAVPPLLWNINWKMYMIFATFCGCACIHMYLFAFETRGKTLEEMDGVFDSGHRAWDFGYAGLGIGKGRREGEGWEESRLDRLEAEIKGGRRTVKVAGAGTKEMVGLGSGSGSGRDSGGMYSATSAATRDGRGEVAAYGIGIGTSTVVTSGSDEKPLFRYSS